MYLSQRTSPVPRSLRYALLRPASRTPTHARTHTATAFPPISPSRLCKCARNSHWSWRGTSLRQMEASSSALGSVAEHLLVLRPKPVFTLLILLPQEGVPTNARGCPHPRNLRRAAPSSRPSASSFQRLADNHCPNPFSFPASVLR